jgi:viroplasmin and RNaseH domain-containing protein
MIHMAKAKKKFYAIKESIDTKTNTVLVQNKIFETWAETEPLVTGKKAEYKSFPTREQAESYLATADPLMHKSDELYPPKALHCYVDGSFNASIPNYGFGLCCVHNKKVVDYQYGEGNNKEAIDMQQIGGELLGAMKAVLYAKKSGLKEVVIFHDYKGVCYHATGYWKRDNNFSETYYQWMQSFFKNYPDIKVDFCKVDAHTGDDFNEIADLLAKKSVGVEPTKAQLTILKKHGLDV